MFNIIKKLIPMWIGDRDSRTVINSFGSTMITAIFALYNGFLGLFFHSGWHCGICAYYILLILIRGTAIMFEHRSAHRPDRRDVSAARHRRCVQAYIMLVLLNIMLIAPIALIVLQRRPVFLSLIPAIAMAAYTTYKVTIAAINLKARSGNSMIRLLRRINFIDALVSVLALQNTLIMVNTRGDKLSMMPFTAATSGIIWLAIVVITVIALIREARS